MTPQGALEDRVDRLLQTHCRLELRHRRAIRMAYLGMSNAEIADALYEVVRTVEGWFNRGPISRICGPTREDVNNYVLGILALEETPEPVAVNLRGSTVDFLIGQYKRFLKLTPTPSAVARDEDGVRATIPGDFVRRGTTTYPVVFFPAGSNRSLRRVLLPDNLDATGTARELIRDQRKPSWLAERRRRFAPPEDDAERRLRDQNLWAICVDEIIATSEGPQLKAHLARYFDAMDSCDAMISELAALPESDLHFEERQMPIRFAHHSQAPTVNVLVNGAGRAAALGMSAVVAFRDRNGGLHALLGHRGTGVATYASCWHVVPSGMAGWRFATLGNPDAPEGSTRSLKGYGPTYLESAILREYSEELFNHPEEAWEDEGTVRRHEAVAALLHTYHAEIEFTGIAVDLVNLRFEVCALIFIADPRYYDGRHYIPGWEHGPQGVHTVPVGGTAGSPEEQLILRQMTPGNTVPTGAAALWAGVDRARELLAAYRPPTEFLTF